MYDGPVLDSHHHLIWDWQKNYPWLSAPMTPKIFGEDWSGLKRDYLIDELKADFAAHNVVKSVHVQANYDMSNPVGETEHLQELADANGFPHGIVAYADLTDPNVEAVLDRHCRFANTCGIRQQVYWHENPHWRFVDRADFCLSNAFRRGLSLVAEKGLTFDWQGFAPQFKLLAELARCHSGLKFCLVHAGMLTAMDDTAVNEWRAALRQLAPLENVFIKVSGLNTFSRQLDVPLMSLVTDTVIDMFGADRCFFGSNFPVEKMWTGFDAYLTAQKSVMEKHSTADNAKFFHDTATRFYFGDAAG